MVNHKLVHRYRIGFDARVVDIAYYKFLCAFLAKLIYIAPFVLFSVSLPILIRQRKNLPINPSAICLLADNQVGNRIAVSIYSAANGVEKYIGNLHLNADILFVVRNAVVYFRLVFIHHSKNNFGLFLRDFYLALVTVGKQFRVIVGGGLYLTSVFRRNHKVFHLKGRLITGRIVGSVLGNTL